MSGPITKSAPTPPKLTSRELRVISELLARCHDVPDVARVIGVSVGELQAMVKADPEGQLARALGEGRSRLRRDLVHSLYTRAMNPKNTQGSVCAMFLLKTLFGFDDRPGGADLGPQVNVQIVLPGPMTEKDYRRKLAATHPGLIAEIDAEVVR